MPTGIDLAPGASWLLYLPAQLHVARSPSPPATRALLSRLVLETDERSRGRDRRRTRLMQGCCGRHRSTCGLLIRATCMHHVQGGADDVTGLLIAALAASILHADRPWQRGPWRCKHAASANALVAMHSRPADVLPMQLQVRSIHCHRHKCGRTNRRTKDRRYERRY